MRKCECGDLYVLPKELEEKREEMKAAESI